MLGYITLSAVYKVCNFRKKALILSRNLKEYFKILRNKNQSIFKYYDNV